MSLIQVLLISQEVTNKDRVIWDSLSKDEQWESYKIAHNSYLKLQAFYEKQTDRENTLIDDLEKTNKLLSKKFTGNGLELLILASASYNPVLFQPVFDSYVLALYHKYFFYGRGQLTIGGAFKFLPNYGGGLIFGGGFNF